MDVMLKRIPLPIAGVMLGLAALGNLLQNYSQGLHLFCGTVAGIIGLLLVTKYLANLEQFKEEIKNPIMASVIGTFSMAIILLAGYLHAIVGQLAIKMWYFGIALHIVLIVYFTVKFMLPPTIPKIFASYYIVYVGIVAASVNAPLFKQTLIGSTLFWFGLVSFIGLLALVTYRYIKYQDVPQPAQSLFCIYTAPLSLCLAGYIQSVNPKSPVLIGIMAVVATVIYFIVLLRMPRLLKLPFYPSAAAFTFPFVISAIALKQSFSCLSKMGYMLPVLYYLAQIEVAVAIVLVFWTLSMFIGKIASTK